MKKLMLAAGLLLSVSGLAEAADMPLKALPPPPPAFTWRGLYAGVAVGGMWAKTDSDFVFPPPASWQQSASVGVASAIVGFEYQWGSLVFGAEGNLGGALSKGLGTTGCNPAGSCAPGTAITVNFADAIWSAGGRVGWAFGYWLPYVSGGYANASFNQALCFPGACEIGRSSHEGSYIGGGLDWAVWGDWLSASNIATMTSRPSGSHRLPGPASATCEISMIPNPSSTPSLSGRPICSARSEKCPEARGPRSAGFGLSNPGPAFAGPVSV
jgi:outer membrane immunogenic protein